MLTRVAVVLTQAILLLVTVVAPSHAALFTGTCAIQVTIRFDEPIRLIDDVTPSYDLTIAGAVDLDPSVSGNQACATTLDTAEPLRRTTGNGTGESTIWTCTTAFGSGSYNQFWTDANGNFSPPSLLGGHTIVGSWDDWTLEVTNPSLNFVGVAELSLDPNTTATALDGCVWGTTTTLRMVGVMVFQDP